MRQELGLLKAEAAPAPIGITDDPIDVSDQNQALGMTEDFAGEITLFLQLGLRLAQAGDVEHEAAVLHHFATRVTCGKAVDKHVDGGSILAPQNFFLIAQPALLLEQLREFFPPPRNKVDLGGYVELNNFFPTAI